MQQLLVIATNNSHKLSEFSALLCERWHVKCATDIAPGVTWQENGKTFLDNARIKITALRPWTKGFILADDSGLCVDALDGAPGVRSSSYGGVEGDHRRNMEALLQAMKAVPTERRTAFFYCLLVLSCPDGAEMQFEGRCHGVIATEPSGLAGFGYDPIFIPRGYKVSMAAMDSSLKNKISHRGIAAAHLNAYL